MEERKIWHLNLFHFLQDFVVQFQCGSVILFTQRASYAESFCSSPKRASKAHICICSSSVILSFPFFSLSIHHPPLELLTPWSFSVGNNKSYMCIYVARMINSSSLFPLTFIFVSPSLSICSSILHFKN